MRQMCSPSTLGFRPPPASNTPEALNHMPSMRLHNKDNTNTYLIPSVLQAQLSVPTLLLLQQRPPARHPSAQVQCPLCSTPAAFSAHMMKLKRQPRAHLAALSRLSFPQLLASPTSNVLPVTAL